MGTKLNKSFILIAFLAALLSYSHLAAAQENSQYRNWNTSSHRQSVTFSQKDRNAIIQYYQTYCARKNARKTQDCNSVAMTRKYTIGQPLTSGTPVRNLPGDLQTRLSSVPRGYEYLKIDRDILIVSSRSGKVMDAVALGRNAANKTLLPVRNSYVVYFNPQTTGLRSGEYRILNQIAREISQYNPAQVTVTSYADSVVNPSSQMQLTDERMDMIISTLNAFGMNIQNPSQITPDNPTVVNQLSTIARRQAENVSKELSNRNITSTIVTSSVRGTLEKDLAIEDDAEAEITQMVVIDFRK